jgi:hypothetical protein
MSEALMEAVADAYDEVIHLWNYLFKKLSIANL